MQALRNLDQLQCGDDEVAAEVPTPGSGDYSSLLTKSLKETAL